MGIGTPRIAALGGALQMLEAVTADGGVSSITKIARDLKIPIATGHRQVMSLVEEGFLIRLERGCHVAGPRLMRMLGSPSETEIVRRAAFPILHRFACAEDCVVHLGTLENDMVTYLIKASSPAAGLFTRVGMQLEAYCSGIGKVLLAELPEAEREAYLAAGPFPALTPQTITTADELREELKAVSSRGHAIDNEEVAEGLRCIAMAVRVPGRPVCTAVSVSRSCAGKVQAREDERILRLLRFAVLAVERHSRKIIDALEWQTRGAVPSAR